MISTDQLYDLLARAVRDMDEKAAVEAAKAAVTAGVDPVAAINKGLVKGMNEAGRLFEAEEYFIPELLLCADAMYAGLAILKPHLKRTDQEKRGLVVIGVVEGDTHDIGKNLVKLMLEMAGFEVIDLGRDVPLHAFADQTRATGADFLCLSTLMSTTMDGMASVIDDLRQEGLRDKVTVLVGGGPVTSAFARRIGADGYAKNAVEAVKVAERLLERRAKP